MPENWQDITVLLAMAIVGLSFGWNQRAPIFRARNSMELARVLRKVIQINRDSDHIIIIDHYKHDFFLDIAIENPESRFFCRVFLGFSFFWMVKSTQFLKLSRHHPLGPGQVTLHALRLQRQEDNQVLIQVRDWKHLESPKIRCRTGG